jgi:ribonuclease J
MDFTKIRDQLLFIPFGGAEEIGMNLYCYHYNGKFIIIDMGIGFADDFYPGVDLVVPDISFLIDHRKDIAGIILTHAHEDHIGAVQYLRNELSAPIYATKFTAAVVKAKCAEAGISDTSFIKEVKPNQSFKLADFDLEFIGLTHSIPEMQGLVIKTEAGTIFHTGDWKFDKDPVVGELSNIKRLEEIGQEGVLAMIGDSTNIFEYGRSGSEGDLLDSLVQIIDEIKKGLVVFTTFASNIARVHSIATAAQKCGRKVALAGRSLWRITDAARESGYLDDLPEFIKTRDISKYKRNELVVISTGCQGEMFAAINKLAKDEHLDFKLQAKDTVIFSSKIIPGNELKIFALLNKLARKDIHVMTEKDHFVHVSGHPCRDEVADMYRLIKPKVAIPVHGEIVHTTEHVEFAKSLGVKEAFRVDNGAVVCFVDNTAEIIGNVQKGELAIDGNFILDSGSEILRTRRRLRDHGLIHITLMFSSKNKLLKPPYIIAPGVLDAVHDQEYFLQLSEDLTDMINDNKATNHHNLENKVRSLVKRFMKNEINKEPKILVSIHKLSL